MIYERADSRRTRLYLPGARVDAAMIESLRTRLDGVAEGSIVVLAGSVPPGLPLTIYRDLLRALGKRGVRCIVDTSGEALGAALEAHPYLVKPNVEEASELLARPLLTDDAVLGAAEELRALGAAQVVVSQGADGAIALNGEGAWKGTAPAIARQSTVGSGDSMVAGLAMALDDALPLCDALRLGCAAGAATAMVSGTQLCRAADVYATLPRIAIRALRVPQEVTR
jgi:1-phosphofructokinase family hexose kinase